MNISKNIEPENKSSHYKENNNVYFHSYGSELVMNPSGNPLLDHKNKKISIQKLLNTRPLRKELQTRPGPGNRKLTFMSGESVTRTLNDIFGFDGWCLEIKNKNCEECMKDEKGRYHVVYTTTVRLIHRRSGVYKEDCGSGDSINKSKAQALGNAMKASVTDAMKRAARYFGEKLGNSLYGNFSLNKAPQTLKEALDAYDLDQENSTFGSEKNEEILVDYKKTNNIGANINHEMKMLQGTSTNTSPKYQQKNQHNDITVTNVIYNKERKSPKKVDSYLTGKKSITSSSYDCSTKSTNTCAFMNRSQSIHQDSSKLMSSQLRLSNQYELKRSHIPDYSLPTNITKKNMDSTKKIKKTRINPYSRPKVS